MSVFKNEEQFIKRTVVVIIIFIAAFVGTIIKLINVSMSSKYDISRSIYHSNKSIQRGNILDRNARPIATNILTSTLYMNGQLNDDPSYVARKIKTVIADIDVERLEKRIIRMQNSKHIIIKRNLTPLQQFNIHRLGIASLFFEKSIMRFYPTNNTFSHIIGFTNIDNEGLSGLESYYNDILSIGQNITTTLDTGIQWIVRSEIKNMAEHFKAKSAVGIVMNAKNGELLAIVSYPDFNPNDSNDKDSSSIFNRATLGTYEIGSVFKIFTMAAALEEEIIELDEIFDISKPLRYGIYTITDFHPQKTKLTTQEVLIYSSNIGMGMIALRLGTEKMYNAFDRFGLLHKVNTELNSGELGESIIRPYNLWEDVNLVTMSYGHGIAVTPLHAISAVASIINNGYQIKPTFSLEHNNNYAREIISKDTSIKIKEMMKRVVSEGTGKRAAVEGYMIGGKTGTALKILNKQYTSGHILAAFVAVVPADDPEYIVFVMADEVPRYTPDGKESSGGFVAAPTVKKIIKAIVPMLRITRIKTDNTE